MVMLRRWGRSTFKRAPAAYRKPAPAGAEAGARLNVLLRQTPLLLIPIFIITLSPEQAYASSPTSPQHGISLLSELKYKPGFKHFSYVNPDAPKGGNVVIANIGTFDSLNPFILKGVAESSTDLLFDTLMASPADEAATAYGLIAESLIVAPDNSAVTFFLNRNARWSDHTPVTADDVVFSFHILTTKGHPSYRAYYHDIKNCETKGSYTVTCYFLDKNNRELPLVIGQLPILSKAYYTHHTFENSSLDIPVTSGPYTIAHVDAGRSITYQRRKDYWAAPLPVNRGRFNFDSIRIDYYRDATVAIEAFKAGEYDFRRENIAKSWATAYNMPQIAEGKVIKEELPDGTPTGMQCFVMNTRRSMFKDPRVREALNYAYDFEWANAHLFFGAYTRNSSFFGNSEYASSGLPDPEELALLGPFRDILPPRVFTGHFLPPATKGDGNVRPNLKKAKALLEEAGWVVRDFQLINPETGNPVVIEFLLDSPSFERIAAPFIRNLKKLGIEGVIRTVDSSQAIKRQEDFDFDIIVQWYRQGAYPGNEQMNYWHSSRADVEGSQNLAGIKNPAVDALVNQLITARDKGTLLTVTHALDRVLLWNFYVIPQWYSRTHRVIYWNKFGRPAITPPYSLGFIDTWWIDTQKEKKLKKDTTP